MAKITGILCQVLTGNVSGAGTDGSVYLGIGGREFRMDSTADDYERGSLREYVMGLGPVEPNLPPFQIRVQNGAKNDPRIDFPLDTVNLGKSPVYIRFEPVNADDSFNIAFAAALVYSTGKFVVAYTPPQDIQSLWMGPISGKVLFLTEEFREGEQAILEKGHTRAGRTTG